MSQPTLVFGVGAAKAGTGWLQSYLRDHKHCFFRNLKELHYFDSLDSGMGGFYRKDAAERVKRESQKLANHADAKNNTWLPVLISDLNEWMDVFDGDAAVDDAYLGYIGFFRGDVSLVGDFTPAYAGCSTAMLRHMYQMGENVRFVYIMRDPVDRLWSHIRMDADGAEGIEDIIEQYLGGVRPNIANESDYRGRMRGLLEVVPRKHLHFEFFERLFSTQAIEKICRFLGVSMKSASYDKPVHKGKSKKLDPLLRMVFQDKLKPQYDFVEELFGGLPREWTDKMVTL